MQGINCFIACLCFLFLQVSPSFSSSVACPPPSNPPSCQPGYGPFKYASSYTPQCGARPSYMCRPLEKNSFNSISSGQSPTACPPPTVSPRCQVGSQPVKVMSSYTPQCGERATYVCRPTGARAPAAPCQCDHKCPRGLNVIMLPNTVRNPAGCLCQGHRCAPSIGMPSYPVRAPSLGKPYLSRPQTE
jgi:hypothetical protein